MLHVPEFALRMALGAMADEALLASARAVPKRLMDAGFQFEQPRIDAALAVLLGADGERSGGEGAGRAGQSGTAAK
jgi:uncharacterized protein